MFTTLKNVTISQVEWNALIALSEQELRPVNDQVRLILREALEKRGLLKVADHRGRQP